MSILKNIREQQNITQEELSEKSGISVRTIQRIEAGTAPKGHTLKMLAQTLGVEEHELLYEKKLQTAETIQPETKTPVSEEALHIHYASIKIINLSSLPFVVFPPANIIAPALLMLVTKQKNTLSKQIISVQMMWTIIAPVVFMLVIFTKPGNKVTLLTMILLVLSNIFIILRNAVAIDQKKQLHYKLNFNMI